MQRIFSSPHIIDLVMALTVLEAIALLLARQRFPRRLFRPRQRHAAEANHDVRTATEAPPPRPVGFGQTPSHQGMRPIGIVLMLLPGLFLMLAIRTALDGAAWPWVPAALAASLLAHLADLRDRWFG